MRTTLIVATCVASLVAAATQRSLAQAPQPAQQTPLRNAAPASYPHGLAVIDVGWIIDHYDKLKQINTKWQNDVQAVGKELEAEKMNLQKMVEKLKNLKAGQPDYKALETEITQREADFRVKAQIKDKEFQEKQAKNLLSAYQEVSAAIKAYAERNGIVEVVRFNGMPPDQNNPDSIRAELGKSVVYYNPSIDITEPVLDMLNKNAAINTAQQQQRNNQPANPKR